MALQSSTTAKTASDTNKPAIDVSNLSILLIDNGISAQKVLGIYCATFDFDARTSNDTIEIKQPDESYIDLNVIILALTDRGYRLSFNEKNTSSGGTKIHLTVAWD